MHILCTATVLGARSRKVNAGSVNADAAPLVLRIIYKGNFTPGPFQLGTLSTPILLMACMSIAFNIVSNRLTASPLCRATLGNPWTTLIHVDAASDRRCLSGVLLEGGLFFVIACLVSDMSVNCRQSVFCQLNSPSTLPTSIGHPSPQHW